VSLRQGVLGAGNGAGEELGEGRAPERADPGADWEVVRLSGSDLQDLIKENVKGVG
jgi:hypothetical protein